MCLCEDIEQHFLSYFHYHERLYFIFLSYKTRAFHKVQLSMTVEMGQSHSRWPLNVGRRNIPQHIFLFLLSPIETNLPQTNKIFFTDTF